MPRSLLAVTIVAVAGAAAAPFSVRPSIANCSLTWFEQTVDHFGFQPVTGQPTGTYKQRVFSYGDFWGQAGCPASAPGPIFFYTGIGSEGSAPGLAVWPRARVHEHDRTSSSFSANRRPMQLRDPAEKGMYAKGSLASEPPMAPPSSHRSGRNRQALSQCL